MLSSKSMHFKSKSHTKLQDTNCPNVNFKTMAHMMLQKSSGNFCDCYNLSYNKIPS